MTTAKERALARIARAEDAVRAVREAIGPVDPHASAQATAVMEKLVDLELRFAEAARAARQIAISRAYLDENAFAASVSEPERILEVGLFRLWEYATSGAGP